MPPQIPIFAEDVISDSAHEVYGYLRAHDITTVLYVGIHLNICVLWRREVSLMQVQKWGFSTVLVRDLTDVLSEVDSLGVPHDEKTRMMVDHVEQYWAESVDSSQLL